jgi:hypothetical protein
MRCPNCNYALFQKQDTFWEITCLENIISFLKELKEPSKEHEKSHNISIKHLNEKQYREMLCLLLDYQTITSKTNKELEEECIKEGYLTR